MAGLPVFVDHGMQGAAVVTRRCREGKQHFALRLDAQLHGQRTHRVEPGVQLGVGAIHRRLGQRVHLPQGLVWRTVAPLPVLSVGLLCDPEHLFVVMNHEMGGMQCALSGQTRLACEHQGLLRGPPLAAQEHVAEGGVGFIGAGIGQGDLKRRNQFKRERSIAAVAKLHLSKLNVVFRAHPHGGVGGELRPTGAERHAVCVKAALVVGLRVRGGVLGQRIQRRRC